MLQSCYLIIGAKIVFLLYIPFVVSNRQKSYPPLQGAKCELHYSKVYDII